MTDLERFLEANGGQLQQQIPIVTAHVLQRASIAFERSAEGATLMHVDVVLSPAAAVRYTIPFDVDGWDGFLIAAQNAGSKIEIPKPRLA